VRRSVVIHGHFYQPPREDPWTGRVPRQPSAAPFHDWNERIQAECYGAVTAARLLDGRGEVRRTLNALEWMSFNFGPTLLAWLETHAPDTYRRVLDADQASCARLAGHGNAIAMACHHAILPLADPRDRRTEILWGMQDFRRRFGREPEGMWLPETAVDSATLRALAAEGIRFTVLAPHQVVSPPPRGLPGRVVTPEGEIAVFVYDGALSHAVAFGDLVRDGEAWARRMATSDEARGARLSTVCTDGETFGHHHTFAEMGLAAAIDHLHGNPDVRVENFASFLAGTPPVHDVELVEPSAWSCAHGVDRWRSACGCRADPGRPSSQAWRRPLREALEWLARGLHGVFEAEAGALLADPWEARDAYGDAAGTHPGALEAFLNRWACADLTAVQRDRAVELLEMERDALRLFTSCAWFFDDVARVEPRQVLTYAAHAIELAGPPGEALVPELSRRLSAARANDPADGTAAEVFAAVRAARVGVGR
jgi:alpha-amylase/alpha-mannosidase (GH57 family)